MDQEKIGKFIFNLRKEKNMTQQELADKLNVTDRAVSHWENGRSLPDVSLFKELCEIFSISVNELISGERFSKDDLVIKSEENIINTINSNKLQKKKSKKIIGILIIIMLLLLTIILINFKYKYPKINLFNFTIQENNQRDLEMKLNINDRNIYYYGVNLALFCDKKEKCYQMNDALSHKQISIDEFQNYLDKQVEYGNYKIMSMYDGGTKIYEKAGMQIIYCNTLNGNKDVYIGNSNMINSLKGGYCGHEKNIVKTFIRTYYIISAVEDNDEDYIDVTLKQYDGNPEIVKVDKSANIIVGRNYEFTFLTYYKFEDTIKNIFENSSIIKIEETMNKGLEQVNEKVYVNDDYNRDVLPSNVNYYYTFTGESNHFIFNDGIADYRDDKAVFEIKNIKSKTKDSFHSSINVYFNDKLLVYNSIDDKSIDEFKISIIGNKIYRNKDGNMYGEIDSFMATNPDKLGSALKIVGVYCDSNNKCSNEEFKLKFTKNN